MSLGARRPGRRCNGRSSLASWFAAALFAGSALATGPAYLAVFVDGRTLEVTGVRLVGEDEVRLELGEGATLTVPLARLDRVIEATVETGEEQLPPPPCAPAFAAEALPAAVPFREEILRAGREADLHPWLVAAVVEAESAFNPAAVSPVGARGLMQLMPVVWLEHGVADPHDVRANLQAGCRHLKRLLERFGDVTLALAAYNAGAATVEQAGGMPPYRETHAFVRRVLAKFCPDGGGGG